MRSLLALSVVALMASMVSADLKTVWSTNAINITAKDTKLAGATTAGVLIVGSNGKVKGVSVSDGSVAWTETAPNGGFQMQALHVEQTSNHVVAVYADPTDPAKGLKLKTFKAADGTVVFEKTISASFQTLSVSPTSLLLLGQKEVNQKQVNTISLYALATGAELVNTTTTAFGFSLAAGANDDIIAVLGAPAGGGFVQIYTFSAKTGDYNCKVEDHAFGFGAPPLAGDILINAGVYNASTCKKLGALPTGTKVAISNGVAYAFEPTSNTLLKLANNGTKIWSATLPKYKNEKYFAVSQVPFNDAVITNTQGHFAALSASTGSFKWNTTLEVPFSAPNDANQQIFPLGGGDLFIPSLQGYIVLATANGGSVKARVETLPLVDVYSFQVAGSPYVVYGEAESGTVKAVMSG